MSEFSAWRGDAQAGWSLGPGRSGSAHVQANDPLRALYKLRRRIPKPIRPSRKLMHELCWEAAYVNNMHGIWVSRPIKWLHREHHLSVDGTPVTLEVSVRFTNNLAVDVVPSASVLALGKQHPTGATPRQRVRRQVLGTGCDIVWHWAARKARRTTTAWTRGSMSTLPEAGAARPTASTRTLLQGTSLGTQALVP
jgi:hypothetical protein